MWMPREAAGSSVNPLNSINAGQIQLQGQQSLYGFNILMASTSLRSNSKTISMAAVILSAAIMSGCAPAKEVSYKSGGMTHTIVQGEDGMPKEFSKLIYPNAKADGSVSAEGNDQEQSNFVMLSSTSPVDDISEWYQKQLKENQWQITSVQTLPRMVSISGQKGDVEMNVMIADDGDKTTINLALGKTVDGVPDENEIRNFIPDKVTPPTD